MVKKIKNNKIILAVLAAGVLTFTISAGISGMPYSAGDFPLSNMSAKESSEISGSILITDNPEATVSQAKSNDLKISDVLRRGKGKPVFVTVDEHPDHPKVKALAKQSGARVEPNYVYKTFLTPNDPKYGDQWNLTKISAPQAWDISTGSSDVTIAVLDTGVLFAQTINGTTYTQPDFPASKKWTNPAESGMTELGDTCWTGIPEDKKTNNCDDSSNGLIDDWQGWDLMGGWRGNDGACPNYNDPTTYQHPTLDYINQDNDPQPYSCDSPSSPNVLNKNHYNGTCTAFDSACFVGHGTMVASAAAAATNNNQLIAGIDHNAKIMSLRVLDGYGYGTSAHLAAGIEYAAENGANVINMSLGGNCNDENFTDSVVESALQKATNAGAVAVAASGNGNLSTLCYPASSSHVVSVGATGQDDKRASYSSYSNKLDVVAPAGVPVANAPSNAYPSNYYSGAFGTSLATPHVAGLAGLLKAARPSLTRNDSLGIIRNSTTKVSGMQGQAFHKEYGYGRINVFKATKQATIVHPAGTLIRNGSDPRVFLVENDQRRYIPSPAVFTSHGFIWGHVKPATVSDMQLPLGQSLSYREGTLIQGSDNPVYVVSYLNGDPQKRHIVSPFILHFLYPKPNIMSVLNNALPGQNGPPVN
ncbi:hypothetical protein BH23PAT1_BH23PAT1_0970 [soil metagenome]